MHMSNLSNGFWNRICICIPFEYFAFPVIQFYYILQRHGPGQIKYLKNKIKLAHYLREFERLNLRSVASVSAVPASHRNFLEMQFSVPSQTYCIRNSGVVPSDLYFKKLFGWLICKVLEYIHRYTYIYIHTEIYLYMCIYKHTHTYIYVYERKREGETQILNSGVQR